jgi:small subunit ribosomal protein S16
MAVKIRMQRMGRRHRPFFRINAIDGRAPRDGRVLEKLGHFDPLVKDPEKQLVLDRERVEYWLDKGATPSDTVSDILLKQGIQHKYAVTRAVKAARARAVAKAKGKLFNTAQKVAAQKQIDDEKAATEAAVKAAEEAAKAKADAKAAKAKAAEEAAAKAAEDAAKAEAEAEAAKAKAAEEAAAQAAEEVAKTEAEAAEAKAEEETPSGDEG